MRCPDQPFAKPSQRPAARSSLFALCCLLLFPAISTGAANETDPFPLSPPPGDTGLPAGWTFAEGAEFPGAAGRLSADNGILKLHYDFREGGAYVAAYRDIEPERALDRLTFRLKKPAEATFTIRITDSHGQTLQKSSTFPHADWQDVAVDLTHWNQFFGGPGDGRLRQPVRRIGILVERQGLAEPAGVVEIADIEARPLVDDQWRERDYQTYESTYEVTAFDSEAGFSLSGPGTISDGPWEVDLAEAQQAFLNHSIALHGRPKALRLSVTGGSPGNRLRLHLGSHFQNFVRDLGELSGDRETFTVPVPPDGWDYYGGQNDGEVRPPLRFTRLEVRRGTGAAEKIELELESLECVTDVTNTSGLILKTSLTPESTGGDGLQLVVQRRNLMPVPLEGDLEIVARDWEGNTVWSADRPDPLEPGRADTMTLALPMPEDRHFVEVLVRYVHNGETLAFRTVAHSRSPDLTPDRELRPQSPWGMGVYLYRFPHSTGGLQQMDTAAAMASSAGVQWSREEFSWSRIEVEPGVYDFRFYDEVVDAATRNGISVYGLLAYWSPWTEPYTEEGIEAFAEFARATVRRYRDRIQHWEIYNEPNIFFWQGPPELYPVLLRRVYEAIKDEDPDARVLGISTAGIDTDFIRMCLEAEAPFDVLTIHPYRQAMNESRFMEELRAVAELVDHRPVWITEMGLPTHHNGATEREQAVFLARSYLGAVASGATQNISWYNFRNDGTDAWFNEHNFGVVRRDLSPKPSYRALATLANSLRDGPWTGEFPAPGIYALRSDRGLAVWSGHGTAEVAIEAGGEVRVVNLIGEPREFDRRDGRIVLSLAPSAPLFILGDTLGHLTVEKRAPQEVHEF